MHRDLYLHALIMTICLIRVPVGICQEEEHIQETEPMSIFEYFADAQWTCDSQWSSGRPFRGRMVYEWGLGGKILRAFSYDTGSEGEYLRYESILTWHPLKEEFRAYGFGFDGSVSIATVEHPNEETFLITSIPDEDSTEPIFRQQIQIIDHDSFEWTVYMEIDDGWQELIQGTYHRQLKSE